MRVDLVLASVIALALSGCDRIGARSAAADRVDGTYRAAMADYSAGRMAAAREGFAKALRANPANAAARFQLACLQQDVDKDYSAAFCNYREYLQQHPDSDKAPLAKERSAICERLYAPELAKRMNLIENAAIVSENEGLRSENERLSKQVEELSAKLKDAVATAEACGREAERLRRLVPSADDSTEATTMKPVTDRELLDDDGEDGDRLKLSEDARNLLLEEKEETAAPLVTKAKEPQPAKSVVPAAEPQVPESYEVKEGETLTEIARRFYGRKSEWVRIRDANKTIISTDGRVRAGQVIVLPR